MARITINYKNNAATRSIIESLVNYGVFTIVETEEEERFRIEMKKAFKSAEVAINKIKNHNGKGVKKLEDILNEI
ncbi:MAG: hypothetical protein MJ069_09935 [Salinivirgaceae bacterium]|nr:hypothetical protein [Salinivirgaceae bacterium]